MALPGTLAEAVKAWLASHGGGSNRAAAGALSRTYRSGGTSASIDFAAYLVARLPATYAAVTRVLAEIQRLRPDFAPRSLLDAGAGPGTASWAAVACWDAIATIRFIDNNPGFLRIAAELARAGSHAALAQARAEQASLLNIGATPKADLVIASYALAELPKSEISQAVLALWRAAADTLVLIEPGTPEGFARIHAARDAVLAAGGFAVAPCPHAGTCPVSAPGWCHFSVRLPRSRAHMHAKGASVPFEDEKFSYIALSRTAGPLPASRIVAPPEATKAQITLKLCADGGLRKAVIARRDREAYKRARRLEWGDPV